MDDLYLISQENLNITYSIDMIRVKCYLSFFMFSELEFRLKTCWESYVLKKWESSRIVDFQYNYVIDAGEENSFWFGFLHNNERRIDNENVGYNFTIEFNPNKVRDSKILLHILTLSRHWILKSCDLAMDLPVSILDIIWDRGLKRTYKVFGNGFDDKTIEVGKGQGRLKIYNKKKESNLNMLGELTRVEVTCEFDDFPIERIAYLYFPDIFPTLYTNDHMYTFEDYKDKTLLAIAYAVQNGFPVNDLTRYYKKKVKNMFEGGSRIKFSTDVATKVLRKVLFHYFLSVNSFI